MAIAVTATSAIPGLTGRRRRGSGRTSFRERVQALADQWNETPDYMPSAYDQGRVDQRHDMTAQLLELLAEVPA